MFHDPLVSRVGLPASLVPQAKPPPMAPSSGTTAAAATVQSAAPTCMLTLLDVVQSICAKAQEAAFPGVRAPTNVQATTNPRQTNDYQACAPISHYLHTSCGPIFFAVRYPLPPPTPA